MIISLIAAIAKNNVIGKDNDLIWHLPTDLKFFKATTSGHHIIMGRKNYMSLNRPLPNRTNIVVTRDRNFKADGVIVVHSIDDAIEVARKNGEDEAFIIGGGEIYAQTIDDADRMYITFVHESFEGDTYFPEIDFENWLETERVDYQQDDRNKYSFTICTFQKKV